MHAAGASSQEEYEASGSEDDHVLASSNENVARPPPSPPPQPPHDVADDSDADDSDDADNATALGRVSDQPIFRPSPNAFSHPSSHGAQRRASASHDMAPHPHPHTAFTRPSFSHGSQARVHRGGPSFMSPSAREDHDAALRASLTTLLSCAAAARRLPKSRDEAETRRRGGDGAGVGPSSQPVELRLVPEAELMDAGPAAGRAAPAPSPGTRKSPARSPTRGAADGPAADKGKRAVSAGRSPRATKKKRVTAATGAADETLISPTLLTWVVSAGVVVLVSVVGFGAGYVMGREVGRQEAMAAAGVGGVNETTQCGQGVMGSSGEGLRRLRWGAVGKSIVAQA